MYEQFRPRSQSSGDDRVEAASLLPLSAIDDCGSVLQRPLGIYPQLENAHHIQEAWPTFPHAKSTVLLRGDVHPTRFRTLEVGVVFCLVEVSFPLLFSFDQQGSNKLAE